MAIYACSGKSDGEVTALNNTDCGYQGLRLFVAAVALYLISGVVSAHLAQIQMLSMLAWAHITQPGAGVAVQALQSLAAISAFASTIQALLGAVPAVTNLIKSAPSDLNSLSISAPAAKLTQHLQHSQHSQHPLPAQLTQPTPSGKWTVPSTFGNVGTTSGDNLRNVLIVLACGILIGSLSPRIGEALIFIYSLRTAVHATCARFAVTATECDTSNSAGQKAMPESEKVSAEDYLVRNICE